MTATRRRFKQTGTLQERVIEWARKLRAEAITMPSGAERDVLLKKVRQVETAMHLEEWANSPGLQSPE
jgi:hypothetical protein